MARPSSKPEASSSSETRDSDYLVPAANVAQTLVKELPPGTKISAEVTALMQTMGTEFMRFASDEANERGTNQGRNSVSASDLTASIEELDLEINSSMQQFSDLVLSRDSASAACVAVQETGPISERTTLSTQDPAQDPWPGTLARRD
jgi:histone H3/H4